MLTYAVNKETNQVEHIRDVKNGTDCNCICPLCKEPLLAKQGAIKDWHFAHISKVECIGSEETALHMRAKEILTSLSFINLPGLDVQVIASSFESDEFNAKCTIEYSFGTNRKILDDSELTLNINVSDIKKSDDRKFSKNEASKIILDSLEKYKLEAYERYKE